MNAIEISYRLKLRGTTQSDVARELGVSQTVVSNTVHGRISSHRVASHIADLLGESVQALWPDRYRFRPRPQRPQQKFKEGHVMT